MYVVDRKYELNHNYFNKFAQFACVVLAKCTDHKPTIKLIKTMFTLLKNTPFLKEDTLIVVEMK